MPPSSKFRTFIFQKRFCTTDRQNLHNRDMCERAMGLRGRGQPTATGSGRDPLDTSSRVSEDAGDNGRVEGAQRLSSPQPHSPLRKKKRVRFCSF